MASRHHSASDHNVKTLTDRKTGSGVKRIVLSFRQTAADWEKNKSSLTDRIRRNFKKIREEDIMTPHQYYLVRGVLHDHQEKITAKSKENGLDPQPEPNPPTNTLPKAGPAGSSREEDAAKQQFCKAFMENYEKAEHVRLFPRPGRKVGINVEAPTVLRHYEAVRMMNKQNTYLCAIQPAGQGTSEIPRPDL
jgi:hypothetical protein